MYRRFRAPSIWNEMNRMQKEMDKFQNEMPAGSTHTDSTFPAINVWADEESALITSEIPGVSKDDLEINVTGDTLTISGNRKPEELPEGTRYHRRERTFGQFSRSIQLPFTVDINKVNAAFKKGVLEVSLPRIEAEKPKKIRVKAS